MTEYTEIVHKKEIDKDFYTMVNPKCMLADTNLKNLVEQYRGFDSQIEALKAVRDRIRDLIEYAMGEHEELLSEEGKTLVTWRYSKPAKTFDKTAFQKAEPEMYNKYLKVNEAKRQFRPKKVNEDE